MPKQVITDLLCVKVFLLITSALECSVLVSDELHPFTGTVVDSEIIFVVL